MGALIVTAIAFYYKGVFGQSRGRGILFCLRNHANMFCERCGCIMEEGTYTCPECGAYYGPVDAVQKLPPWRYLIVSFVISAAAMSFISWSVGVYLRPECVKCRHVSEPTPLTVTSVLSVGVNSPCASGVMAVPWLSAMLV